MKKIYCISGLGADHSVFLRLQIPGYQLIPVQWLQPIQGESLGAYALRMRNQIDDKEPIVLGLSFGGLIAQAIAKQSPVNHLLLLSTAKSLRAIRSNLLFFKYLPIYKWMPGQLLKWIFLKNIWVFGPLSKRNQTALRQMIASFDAHFFRWSFDAIFNFKPIDSKSVKTTHIHGSKDWLFPIEQAHADFVVMDAGHLMVLTHARRVSGLLQAVLPPPTSLI